MPAGRRDAPVARYRPGFATATSIADLLAHRSGLPPSAGSCRRELPPGSLVDWDAGVALAYTPSRLVLSAAGPDPREQPMVAALYACL
ncbi:hypothetical protein [Microbispora bryophytorum]|uniref:hypothetical protein n=1 Tax=Microbispora bryophytorum TaxID=1460882 RepID=UPI0033F75FC4